MARRTTTPAEHHHLPIFIKGRVSGFGTGEGGDYIFVQVLLVADPKQVLSTIDLQLTRSITLSLEPTCWQEQQRPNKDDLILINDLSWLQIKRNQVRWRGWLCRLWKESYQAFFDNPERTTPPIINPASSPPQGIKRLWTKLAKLWPF